MKEEPRGQRKKMVRFPMEKGGARESEAGINWKRRAWSPWRKELEALAAVYLLGKGGITEASGVSMHTAGLEIMLNAAQGRGWEGKNWLNSLQNNSSPISLLNPTCSSQPQSYTKSKLLVVKILLN